MIINTIYGPQESTLLHRKDGVIDNDNENTTWTEYWQHGELVHRSVHVTLKRCPGVEVQAGEI